MTTYRLWPSTNGDVLTSDSEHQTMGCQFTLSVSATLHAIWWWSPSGAALLPTVTAIYQVTSPGNGSVVSGTENDSPSWSGAAGSGWVSVAYADTVTLSPSTAYKVAVFLPGGNANQYSGTANYWSSGPGASGITNGPLTGVNNATADGGQDTFTDTNVLAYPASSFNAGNYWVDVEVTATLAPPPPPTVLYQMRSFP